MHLLIPFASSDAAGCAETAQSLRLPHLEALLQRLVPVDSDNAPASSLSPPHERALARLCGMAAADGCIAWAAREAQHNRLDPTDAAWAWIAPAHWNVGAHHIDMTDPLALGLDEAQSRVLLAAMAPYFAEDGITLEYAAPDRWLAHGEVFRALPSAALDRVVGRDIQAWMPLVPALRRLQNEMQMLLYTHPANDARSARGQTSVNSFWVSGTGAMPAAGASVAAPAVTEIRSLRDAALHGDWAAWSRSWVAVDAQACQELLGRLGREPDSRLILCGERNALSFGAGHGNPWRRLRRRWTRPRLQALQDQL